MRFDTLMFLTAEVGSVQGVLTLFRVYGLEPPNTSAVEKWFQRGAIPGGWLAMILSILEVDRGKPVSVSKYIKKEASG